MERIRKLVPLSLVLAVVAWGAAPAAAQESPIETVRSRNQLVKQVLDRTPGDSVAGPDRERLKDVINGLMDFQELSRRALARYWNDRTDAEKADFVDTFRELVRNSSVKKISVHRADSITYRPADIEGDEATLTTVAYKDRRSAEIVYHMHKVDGDWKAWDVVIDGSSTMRTYRDSFTREIRATSFETMLNKLKDRLEQERGEGNF